MATLGGRTGHRGLGLKGFVFLGHASMFAAALEAKLVQGRCSQSHIGLMLHLHPILWLYPIVHKVEDDLGPKLQ